MKLSQLRFRIAGMTLVETLVAAGITSLLFMVVGSATVFFRYSMVAMANYNDLQTQSRSALDRMTREIRQSSGVGAFSTNSFSLVNADGSTIQYAYSPNSRTLTRTQAGQNEVVLQECGSLTFSNFQRNVMPGTYTQYAAGTNTSKMIQLNWVCSRAVMGSKINTECVQSAKVVIRDN
jgi:Tfp pilus assembly protein PilW